MTLLKILKAVTLESLVDEPKYQPNFMLPLFSTIYADGQQMLTFMGIILDSHDDEISIKNTLKNHHHIGFSWDAPCKISVPSLTIREITEINKLLPGAEKEQLIENFPFLFSEKGQDVITSYMSYYQFYPNYHLVSF